MANSSDGEEEPVRLRAKARSDPRYSSNFSSVRQVADVPVTIDNRQKQFRIDVGRIRKSFKKLQEALNCADRVVGLLLVDDDEIQKLNKAYLDRDRPTNVLSFAMTEGEYGNINPQTLGDIVISVETAHRDAVTGRIQFMDEVEYLIIHGLLHLLGYNHEGSSAAEAALMHDRERELFQLLCGYPLA